uniref:Ribosomal RNA large subunit methyltransferase K/L-like methyltransferase domain-containing protein n=1 Tax=Gouania willdenowi TaxID=441366 RepID=A0A8C5E5E2_GOUWI
MEKENVRYYCTAGNGMESFLIDEVKKKLKAEDVCRVPGKVVFSTSESIQRVTELKSAERLFLLLKHDTPLNLCAKPGQASNLLQSRLLGDIDSWTKAAATWSRLQEELVDRVQKVDKRGKERIEKKRKRENEEEEERKRASLDEKDRKRIKSPQDVEETEDNDGGTDPVSFRINCKCTGPLARCLSSQEAGRVIGVGVSRSLGWKSDLKNPQMEINVNLSDDQWILGMQLTRLPLANRSYLINTGVRSTVAWAMASLAHIQPGFCVLDPMCGVGTVLVEAALEHQDACFLGADIDDGQLQKANQNVAHAALGKQIQLFKASCMALPLPSASVDAVICDLPFGRKFGTKQHMTIHLPLIITEMQRVLRPGGFLVLLLTPQLSVHLKKHLSTGTPAQELDTELQCNTLEHQATFRVSLGAIDGLIQKYVREKNGKNST